MQNIWKDVPCKDLCNASTAPISLSKNYLAIMSLGTCFGQYLLFLICANAYTPWIFKWCSPSKTQKHKSITTTFPVFQSRQVKCNNNPTVISRSENLGCRCCLGCYQPLTSSSWNRTPLSAQQMVWYLFPNGFGFYGKAILPWQVHLWIHIIMDSSRQLIQEEVNLVLRCKFNVSISCQT